MMLAIKRLIKKLFFFLDGIILLLPVKSQNSVIINKTDEIGDFVLWLGSAHNYKSIYKNRQIILIVNCVCLQLLKKEEICHQIIELDKGRFRSNLIYRLKTLFKIRKVGAQTIINVLYSRDLYISDAIVRCSGAKNRIGIHGDMSNYECASDSLAGEKAYTELLDIDINGLHELEINSKLQSILAGETFPLRYPQLQYNKDSSGELYYVLFPGAGNKNRQWPLAFFAQAAKWIYAETGMTGMVCGVKDEFDLGESLLALSQVPMVNMAGKTSLSHFVDKIANAQFLLSNDTSAVHIASATNTPSLAILGGGHFGRFLPYVRIDNPTARQKTAVPSVVYQQMDCYGCGWHCQFTSYNELVPCINNIEPDSVIAKLEVLFADSLFPGS